MDNINESRPNDDFPLFQGWWRWALCSAAWHIPSSRDPRFWIKVPAAAPQVDDGRKGQLGRAFTAKN
jgi:hypothetical protein